MKNQCFIKNEYDNTSKRKVLRSLLLAISLSIGTAVYSQTNTIKITGVVTDSKKNPIAGATVGLPGGTKATKTNAKGEFELEVVKGGTLQINYVGFETQSLTANESKGYSIILAQSNTVLDQVVVVSYGKSTKKELIGSISTVNFNEAKNAPISRFEQALQGKVPGLMVTQSTGEPGAAMNINIRGVGTIGDSDPLYVIDGLPTKTGLNALNPNDIESVSVLKDASAASMYGSRAANGVILVTTKSGKSGRNTLDVDIYTGVQNNLKEVDMLNASEWAEVRNKATLNDNPNGNVPWKNVNQLGKGTNWQDEILQKANIQNFNLAATGGNEKTKYAVSVNHFDQEGIIKYSNYTRNSVRANIQSSPVKWLNIGNNFSLSQVKTKGVDIEVNGVLKNAILAVPTMKVYNEDGSFAGPNTLLEGNGRNPVSMAANSFIKKTMYRVTDNFFTELNITNDLSFKSSVGVDLITESNRDFNPTFQEGDMQNNESSLAQRTNLQLDWIWENTINYKRSFDKHNLKVLGGFSMEENKKDWTAITKYKFPGNADYLQYLSNGSTVDANDVTGLVDEWSMISYFGRVDYNYAQKYLFSANARIDGSSRFAPGNRYATFPSFAAGWRISEERFLKEKISWLNDLKIKASWGQLGNQDIGLYAYSSVLSPVYYNFNGNPVVGYAPKDPFNSNISWETTSQTDLGFELSAFNGAISLEAGYYNKKTTDMLVKLPVSSVNGFDRGAYVNSGSIRNSGFEFSISHAKNTGELTYSINANISTLKNKVLSLGGIEKPIDDNIFFDYVVRTAKGEPMRQMYGYVMEGIYQDQAEINAHLSNTSNSTFKPGDVRYKDLNNNGQFDPGDRTVIGNPMPKLIYGFSFNAAYKGVDFSMQLQGVAGNDIYNASKWWSENTGETHNYGRSVLESWDGKGSSNTMPRLTLGSTQNNLTSTRFVEKGDYLRLKNLQIGYSLSKKLTDRLLIRSFRVYASAQNLLTITKYKGFNPEVGSSRSDNRSSFGFDEITYPQARIFTLGFNVGIF